MPQEMRDNPHSIDHLWTPPVTLTSLKTILELRTEPSLIDFYAVKVPVRLANKSLNFNDTGEIETQHLRRFIKEEDLPCHLRSPQKDPTKEVAPPESTAPSYLHLLVGPKNSVDLSELTASLLEVLQIPNPSDVVILTVPVPRLAPTSQQQAQSWSQSYWPTIYKKSNPFGPHPSIISRAETELKRDLHVWIKMAMQVAAESKSRGYGEAIGAIVLQRIDQTCNPIALAGDRRWVNHHQRDSTTGAGDVMAHSVLRVVDMVSQKLSLALKQSALPLQDSPHQSPLNAVSSTSPITNPPNPSINPNSALSPPLPPFLHSEQSLLSTPNLPPESYLCHNLEIYITHEPCVMCSMAILHSRFGRVIFGRRMGKTGGLCGEVSPQGEGLGYGLWRRRELNWSVLAWRADMVGEKEDNGLVVQEEVHV